jgi:hypothetical protein
MHEQAYEFIAVCARDLGRVGFVLEIGSRNVNGAVRELFDAERYIGVDVMPGPGVDIVASGRDYVPDTVPHVVVCCEVLEHTAEAEAIVAHALSLLPVGGVLLLTAAGPERAPHSAIDGGPLRSTEHYRNITIDDLEQWLAAADDREIVHNPVAGDVYARAVKA